MLSRRSSREKEIFCVDLKELLNKRKVRDKKHVYRWSIEEIQSVRVSCVADEKSDICT